MSEYRSGQPPKAEAYTAPENAATSNRAEDAGARSHNGSDITTARRGPGQTNDPNSGVEWGQGRGVRGAKPVDEVEAKNTRYAEEASGMTDDDGQANIADVPPAEGRVARAVERKSGTQRTPGSGEGEIGEQDFASDLDRKKAEQAEAREQIKQAREAGIDVDDGLGQNRGILGDESLAEA